MSKENKQTISKEQPNTLIKCPFCGGEHIIKTYFNWNPALLCSCGVVMTVPMDWRTNKEEELERKWNTRKPVDDVVEQLEAMIFTEWDLTKMEKEDPEYLKIAENHNCCYENAIRIVKEIMNAGN